MRAAFGLRTWTLILCVLVLATGLAGVTGLVRLAEQHRATVAELEASVLPAADTARGEAVQAMKQDMRHAFRVWVGATSVLVFVGVLFVLYFYHVADEMVLSPIERVGRVLDEVSAGDPSYRVPEQSERAVSKLGRSVNRFLDHYEDFLGEAQTRITEKQRQLLAAMEALPDAAVLLNDAGDIMVANAAAREWLTGDRGAYLQQALRHGDTEFGDVLDLAYEEVSVPQSLAAQVVFLRPARDAAVGGEQS